MATRETTVKLTVADNFSAQLRSFATALDQSEKAVQKASKQMSVFDDANKQLASGIRGGASLALASLPALAIGAGAAMAKMGMDMQQTRVAFTTLTGSAELANQHLQDLRDFAKTTPFQFNELTDASKKMMAFGFATQDVIPMMNDIGDAVSALGAGSEGIDSVVRALGQMQAKGKVTAEEMNQLTEVGISGWQYLADGMGKTTAEVMKMSEKGLIPAGDAIQYLLKGMREDFGGGMAAQSKTAAGQLSNLADSITEIGTTIGEMMVPALTTAIEKIGEFINTLKEGVKTADLVINWQGKLADAYEGTAKKILAEKSTYEDYKNSLMATARAAELVRDVDNGMGAATQIVSERVKVLTEEEWKATRAFDAWNETRDESLRNWGRETEAIEDNTLSLKEQEDARKNLANAMTGTRDLAVQYTEDAKKLADMQRDLAKATGEQREELEKQIETFKKSSEIERATAIFQSLGKSLEEGKLGPEQYAERMDELNKVTHFYTEEALNAAIAQGQLMASFTDPASEKWYGDLQRNRGELDGVTEAERAATESSRLAAEATREKASAADEYKNSLKGIPENIETVVTTKMVGMKDTGGASAKELSDRTRAATEATERVGSAAQAAINAASSASDVGTAKIIEVATTADGKITELTDNAKSKFSDLNSSVSSAMEEMGSVAGGQLDKIYSKVDKLPTYKKLVYEIVTIGSAPGLPGAQHGANFIVPPNPRGGAGDYFPVLAAAGERVIVQTPAQQRQQAANVSMTPANAPASVNTVSNSTVNHITINDPITGALAWQQLINAERQTSLKAEM